MNFLALFVFAVRVVIATLAGLSIVQADAIPGLPIRASAERPALLLELGKEPPSEKSQDNTVKVFAGEVFAHEGDTAIQVGADDISSLHPGFGSWKVGFRFKIRPGLPAGGYTFWARWRQGGDPNVCVQSFEVWAGSDPSRLELRATLPMRPKGWEYAWMAADLPVNLKSDDAFVEVLGSGPGHDAKVFDAFLLAPPLSALPAAGSSDRPLVLLELGKTPALARLNKDPAVQVQVGTATGGLGAASVLTEKDEVQVFHQGFGSWDASFRFELNPAIAPGQYRFYARYKSGGEVSQVGQKFSVKAGATPDQLATRGDFTLTNNTPWEYQWLQAVGTVTVLPGDRWLEIGNTGKADGAKVFDAFLLELESPLGDWMNAEQAQSRNRFLALTKVLPDASRRLYLLDGKDDKGGALFGGLSSAAARTSYEDLSVSYLVGSEAENLARELNLPTLPAAVMTDDHYTVLGVLAKPANEQQVVQFLSDPGKVGTMPNPSTISQGTPQVAKDGKPAAWLVGGLQDGLAGVSVFGVDGETVLRPNPGQPYLSLQMMGGEIRAWRSEAAHADGSVDIEPRTQHSYGWSRGSGYAQLYMHVEKSTDGLLHVHHSGIASAAWLDGRPLKLSDDPTKPPAGFSPSPVAKIKSLLQGLTTEGLVAKAIADDQQAPQLATLNLSPGWHSLLVKLVMQHDQGQRFYFAGRFTDSNGRPLDDIETQLTDPDAELALNRIAARLRPRVFVDAAANLPHPGDSSKLRVDMRWHPVLEETELAAPLPRFQAKLRLRLVDYAGNEVAVRETSGLFPGQVEMDFGKIAEPGYYAVYASLHTQEGRLIMQYPADGFSVVGGAAEQKQRLDRKKLWNNDYYALADGDKSFKEEGGYFTWLERMGIYKSYGSYPGFDAQYRPKWQRAKQLGLVLFADSAGDSSWLNDNPKDGQQFFSEAAAFSRFFKASNEIDIRHEPEWQKLRDPAHWLERAKWEYEQAHKARSDAHYVGGSLVRPGEGDWFKEVLQLGLDHYQDAWDVHAYPQQSPRFGGPIGNGSNEDERGVLAAYASLGRKNTLPFWLGETGAKAMHGLTGRRWQAEQVAKMIAWVNSRGDYLGLAFCIGHEYDLAYGRIWDYSMGHKPGEAALYTAGALIDGLPYKAVDSKDANIQGAYFGETLMIWRSDETNSVWPIQLDPKKTWVLVDVVGRVRELPVDANGKAGIPISASPVYVLARNDYQRLTRQ